MDEAYGYGVFVEEDHGEGCVVCRSPAVSQFLSGMICVC